MKKGICIVYSREDGIEICRTKTSSPSYFLDGKEVVHILGHQAPIPMEYIHPVNIVKMTPSRCFISSVTANEAH